MPDKDDLEDDFALKPQQQPGELPLSKPKAAKKSAARGKGKAAAQPDEAAILSYRHNQKRKNNPDVGVVTPETDPEQPKTAWAYDPHIDPALQFDSGRAQIEKLIDDALGSGDEAAMCAALDFYKHEKGWSNRLIAGNSLMVMNSL